MERLLPRVIALTLLPLAACHKSAPPAAPPVEASALPAIQVRDKAKMLFTFAASGSFETVSELSKVAEGARGWVRVVDLGIKPERRMDHELVYVADLREARKDGTFPYVVMSRSAFETLAQNRSRPGATAPASAPVASGASSSSGKVVLYATSWCPACRAAREYMQSKNIPFVERDIEKDSGAADELLQKARAQGISASGVPVLEVNGTLMQGFDPERLTQLLNTK
jgi:glutaredoxin 3